MVWVQIPTPLLSAGKRVRAAALCLSFPICEVGMTSVRWPSVLVQAGGSQQHPACTKMLFNKQKQEPDFEREECEGTEAGGRLSHSSASLLESAFRWQ